MRLITRIKYSRIQSAYKKLRATKMSHSFCVDMIKEFFCLKDESTISTILNIELDINPNEEYQHFDLDNMWIEARLKKHFKNHIKNKNNF